MPGGITGDLPDAPAELIFLRYREKFNLSWSDFLETPWRVVRTDLEIWGLENQVLQSKQKQFISLQKQQNKRK